MSQLLPVARVEAILAWTLETTLVAAALAALAFLLGRARCGGRALSPAARHALWLVVLVKFLTPPLVHWPWSWTRPAETRPDARPNPSPAAEWAAPRSVWREEPPPERRAPTVGPAVSQPAAASNLGLPPLLFASAVSMLVEETSPAPEGNDPLGAEAGCSSSAAGGGSGPGIDPPVSGRQTWGYWLLACWAAGSVAVGLGQGIRIGRFRARVQDAEPVPAWMADEARAIGRRLGVRTPEVVAVPGLGTPLLWCLQRPVLLIPRKLLGLIEPGRWTGILTHELAHLRRGDHWVCRLELIAGLIWWWNPVFWLVRRRLDAEAELSCDAWVVATQPGERLTYADSLVRICSVLSTACPQAPALGAAGPALSLERRLLMIVKENAPCRPSAAGLFAAALMAGLALPSWTRAAPATDDDPTAEAVTEVELVTQIDLDDRDSPAAVELKADIEVVADLDDDGRFDVLVAKSIDDNEDDDQDADKEDEGDAKKPPKRKEKPAGSALPDAAKVKELEAFGKEIEARMKEIGERIGREMEEKFGPDSHTIRNLQQKLNEELGSDSEFARQLEKINREIAEQLGPGSEFAREMEKLSKELGAKAAGVIELQEKLRRQQEDSSTQRRAAADLARERAERARERAERARERVRGDRQARAARETSARERRIRAIEQQIERLTRELEELRSEDDGPEAEEAGSKDRAPSDVR